MFKPLLRGEHVFLSTLTPEDAATAGDWFSDAEFMRLFDTRPAQPRTTASLARWFKRALASPRDYFFGVRLLESGMLIGLVMLDGIDWANGAAGIAVAIGETPQRGRGYGSEAAALALDFAFRELNLHCISATVFSYNIASIALFEKLGFTHEGVHRERIHRDGQRFDMLLFGLLRPEWEARRSLPG